MADSQASGIAEMRQCDLQRNARTAFVVSTAAPNSKAVRTHAALQSGPPAAACNTVCVRPSQSRNSVRAPRERSRRSRGSFPLPAAKAEGVPTPSAPTASMSAPLSSSSRAHSSAPSNFDEQAAKWSGVVL